MRIYKYLEINCYIIPATVRTARVKYIIHSKKKKKQLFNYCPLYNNVNIFFFFFQITVKLTQTFKQTLSLIKTATSKTIG